MKFHFFLVWGSECYRTRTIVKSEGWKNGENSIHFSKLEKQKKSKNMNNGENSRNFSKLEKPKMLVLGNDIMKAHPNFRKLLN